MGFTPGEWQSQVCILERSFWVYFRGRVLRGLGRRAAVWLCQDGRLWGGEEKWVKPYRIRAWISIFSAYIFPSAWADFHCISYCLQETCLPFTSSLRSHSKALDGFLMSFYSKGGSWASSLLETQNLRRLNLLVRVPGWFVCMMPLRSMFPHSLCSHCNFLGSRVVVSMLCFFWLPQSS